MGAASPTVHEMLATGRPSFSFEFFPPRNDEGERQLWQTIRRLEPLRPSFVSVTYGAGGPTRDRTVRVTERIASETTLTPVGHLTCVGHSRDELRRMVGRYADAGVRNVLASRRHGRAAPGFDTIDFYLNDGNGLLPKTEDLLATGPIGAIADLNGDGAPDVLSGSPLGEFAVHFNAR